MAVCTQENDNIPAGKKFSVACRFFIKSKKIKENGFTTEVVQVSLGGMDYIKKYANPSPYSTNTKQNDIKATDFSYQSGFLQCACLCVHRDVHFVNSNYTPLTLLS